MAGRPVAFDVNADLSLVRPHGPIAVSVRSASSPASPDSVLRPSARRIAGHTSMTGIADAEEFVAKQNWPGWTTIRPPSIGRSLATRTLCRWATETDISRLAEAPEATGLE